MARTFPEPRGSASVPGYLPVPFVSTNDTFGTFTFPTGADSWIWYSPFRVPTRTKVTGFRIELIPGTNNPNGTGDKRIAVCFYRDVEWEAGIGQTAQGRFVPLTKQYEETFNILTGGVYRGNMDFTLTTPQIFDPYSGREGGDIFFLAGQIEGGFGASATTVRSRIQRNTMASAHIRSEVGTFPITFSDNPTGTFLERAQPSPTINGATPAIDTINMHMELFTEPA